jgi:hypothetical protein
VVDSQGESESSNGKEHSRRGLLKMAGAALAGAAGAAALRAVPAAALTGQYVVQGQLNIETADQPTQIANLSTTGPLTDTGSALTGWAGTGLKGSGYFNADHTQEIGLLGISKGTAGDGSNGPGTGVMGLSHSGSGGKFMSATGYDAQLGALAGGAGTLGSGRLAMIGRSDVGGVSPNWNPSFFTVSSVGATNFQHEFVRGNDGSIWASRAAKLRSGIPPHGRWKRINTVRTDSADGLGTVFKPFRAYDSRLHGGAKAFGAVYPLVIAGTGSGLSSIPFDAVAVMGNLTATGYGGPGFLTIMPGGIAIGTGVGQFNPAADPSSVNFIVGQAAIANSFVCGLNAGQLQVYVGLVASHFIVDITAYLQ